MNFELRMLKHLDLPTKCPWKSWTTSIWVNATNHCLPSQARIEPSSNGLHPWGGRFLLLSTVAKCGTFGEWVDDPKIIQKYPTNMRKQYKTLFKWWFKSLSFFVSFRFDVSCSDFCNTSGAQVPHGARVIWAPCHWAQCGRWRSLWGEGKVMEFGSKIVGIRLVLPEGSHAQVLVN